MPILRNIASVRKQLRSYVLNQMVYENNTINWIRMLFGTNLIIQCSVGIFVLWSPSFVEVISCIVT